MQEGKNDRKSIKEDEDDEDDEDKDECTRGEFKLTVGHENCSDSLTFS